MEYEIKPGSSKEGARNGLGLNPAEKDFFAKGEELNEAVQQVAEDVVGRALTREELARISAEVQVRLEEKKSGPRKFFERYKNALAKGLAVLLGVGSLGATYEKMTAPEAKEPTVEVGPAEEEQVVEKVVEAELDQKVVDTLLKLAESNLIYKDSPEYLGRLGRPEWSPAQGLAYSELPTEAKMYELHPEFGNYSDLEFIQHFDDMMEVAKTEFKHTDLREQIVMGAIDRLVLLAPTMQAEQLQDEYDTLVPQIEHELGKKYSVLLRTELLDTLEENHLLRPVIAASHLEADQILLDKTQGRTTGGKRIQRSVEFDQQDGAVDVVAHVGDQSILLASFPGNGGDPRAGIGRKTIKEHASTRPGEFKVVKLEKGHVSRSWQFSWIPEDAPIKQVGDQIMYGTPDGKFHYATGSNAEFMGLTPFDGQLTAGDRSLLEAAGTEQRVDVSDIQAKAEIKKRGGWLLRKEGQTAVYLVPPSSFTAQDFVEQGKLVSIWNKNDFGPRSLLYKKLDGTPSPQLFHSSPSETKGETFLQTSHGCIHMYQEDMSAIFELVNPGDIIRINPIKRQLVFEDTIVKG